jgi:CRP-like cAMP-binding protein
MEHKSQIINMLKEHSIFSSLDYKSIEKISSDPRCFIKLSKEGDDIIDNCASSPALGLILEGTVLVYRKGGGLPVLLQRLTEGKLFGVSTLFCDSSEYLTELKAGSSCKVFFLPCSIITELITSTPSFAIDYIKFLSGKIRFLNGRLSELSAPSALQKLASFLIKGEGKLALSKVQLASALGIGRASLYRAIDELIEKGYISSDGKQITVKNREGLISLI